MARHIFVIQVSSNPTWQVHQPSQRLLLDSHHHRTCVHHGVARHLSNLIQVCLVAACMGMGQQGQGLSSRQTHLQLVKQRRPSHRVYLLLFCATIVEATHGTRQQSQLATSLTNSAIWRYAFWRAETTTPHTVPEGPLGWSSAVGHSVGLLLRQGASSN